MHCMHTIERSLRVYHAWLASYSIASIIYEPLSAVGDVAFLSFFNFFVTHQVGLCLGS